MYIPENKADLIDFISGLPEGEPLYWLGLGSNLLVRDGGIKGTVINTRNRLKEMRLVDSERVYVEAGVPCAHVARFCADLGLTGAEFLAGIPGTMGGALKMTPALSAAKPGASSTGWKWSTLAAKSSSATKRNSKSPTARSRGWTASGFCRRN